MGKKATKRSELSNTETLSNADATRLVDMNADEITQLKGKIVPLIQVISGPEQGKIFKLNDYEEFLVGRSQSCDLSIPDTSCSRRHAIFHISKDEEVSLHDLGSTNGTQVNSKRISEEVTLQDGDMVQFGDHTRIKFSLSLEQDAQLQMDVFHRATRDMLTNAYNRRAFDEALDREVAFVNRGHAKEGLGLIIFDVDHFKKINDTYGHSAGDEVLRVIGQRVPELVRKEDVFARIGGEEFGVLTRNETQEALLTLAERIRDDFSKTTVRYENININFTVSVGLSYLSPKSSEITKEELFKLADSALYDAKNGGRNKVCIKSSIYPV